MIYIHTLFYLSFYYFVLDGAGSRPTLYIVSRHTVWTEDKEAKGREITWAPLTGRRVSGIWISMLRMSDDDNGEEEREREREREEEEEEE